MLACPTELGLAVVVGAAGHYDDDLAGVDLLVLLGTFSGLPVHSTLLLEEKFVAIDGTIVETVARMYAGENDDGEGNETIGNPLVSLSLSHHWFAKKKKKIPLFSSDLFSQWSYSLPVGSRLDVNVWILNSQSRLDVCFNHPRRKEVNTSWGKGRFQVTMVAEVIA